MYKKKYWLNSVCLQIKRMSYNNQGGYYGNYAPQSYTSPAYNKSMTCMSQKQMGKTQILVNLDETLNYEFLGPGERLELQTRKHNLEMNGIFDPEAQKILDKY